MTVAGDELAAELCGTKTVSETWILSQVAGDELVADRCGLNWLSADWIREVDMWRELVVCSF